MEEEIIKIINEYQKEVYQYLMNDSIPIEYQDTIDDKFFDMKQEILQALTK